LSFEKINNSCLILIQICFKIFPSTPDSWGKFSINLPKTIKMPLNFQISELYGLRISNQVYSKFVVSRKWKSIVEKYSNIGRNVSGIFFNLRAFFIVWRAFCFKFFTKKFGTQPAVRLNLTVFVLYDAVFMIIIWLGKFVNLGQCFKLL
jgi:hypothetical protein